MRHRISPAMLVACAALFFSLGGAGMAATGYRITSLWQIAPRVRHELRGARGPAGPPGPTGPPGPNAVVAAADPMADAYVRRQTVTLSSAQAQAEVQQAGAAVIAGVAVCNIPDRAVGGGYEDAVNVDVTQTSPPEAPLSLVPYAWEVFGSVVDPGKDAQVTIVAECVPAS